MGLAFVDLMVLLFEGRGGRFHDRGDGTLDYEPSGREPVLHVGSGRGVPYHAKTEYALRGPRPPLPRFLGPDEIAGFVRRGSVDLRRDVWPLMAKEVGWGYYHELFAGHPDRVRGAWDDFAAALRRARLVHRRRCTSWSPGSCPTPPTASTSSGWTAPSTTSSAPDLAEPAGAPARLRRSTTSRATSTTATPPSSGRSSPCCRCTRRSRSSRARRP